MTSRFNEIADTIAWWYGHSVNHAVWAMAKWSKKEILATEQMLTQRIRDMFEAGEKDLPI